MNIMKLIRRIFGKRKEKTSEEETSSMDISEEILKLYYGPEGFKTLNTEEKR